MGAGKEIEKPSLEIAEGTLVVILEGSRHSYGEKFIGKKGELVKIIKPANNPDYEASWAMVKLETGLIINFLIENIAAIPEDVDEISSRSSE